MTQHGSGFKILFWVTLVELQPGKFLSFRPLRYLLDMTCRGPIPLSAYAWMDLKKKKKKHAMKTHPSLYKKIMYLYKEVKETFTLSNYMILLDNKSGKLSQNTPVREA